MKQIFLLFSIFSTLQIHATIRRVNNTPGLQGVYPTLYDGILIANPGDTIHIEPSGIDYNYNYTISVFKKLTILGNGSNLFLNPGLQADTSRARIVFTNGQRIAFLFGSEGSYISCNINRVGIDVDSITIDKSYISEELVFSSFTSNSNQIKIARSYLGQLTKQNSQMNLPLKNCIINSLTIPTNNYFFENCIIRLNNFSNGTYNNCIITKSILTATPGAGQASVLFQNCTLNDNIITNTVSTFGLNGSDSISNQFLNQSTIFNQFPTSNFTENDYRYVNTFNPNNKGPYVGNKPYTFGTIPAIPSIFELIVPSTFVTGGPGNTLPITISTRGNQ